VDTRPARLRRRTGMDGLRRCHGYEATTERKLMTRYALAGAALFATALIMPAAAQEAISEPGYCAQFYPNANCENMGPGNPYSDGGYWSGSNARANDNAPVMQPPGRRHRAHRRQHQAFQRDLLRARLAYFCSE
jgi:hypothetical protein